MRNGKREGKGTQLWPDGAKYEGEWRNGKACGKGKFWHVDGDVFEGDWENDKANGYGVYTHKDGAQYNGYWKDDCQHGSGVETWADGSRYEGEYKLGKKDGQGVYFWADGSQYNGTWVNNNIEGKVKLKGSLFRELISGMMEGCTRENGRITICMGMESIFGQTAENMKGSTTRTRSRGTGFTTGVTEESTTGCGRTVCSTARECSMTPTERRGKDCGRTANG
eukprot:TRINITY_DN5861_c0_g1_i10.p2 TRINITY_DN5861_c0_g1~~TRINITY_DN5861_c0_g1_i10.p2  ORF type:complete len:223 (+),score=39.70 TRINITY_DN5861_c0_g1_i10:203-871(+)